MSIMAYGLPSCSHQILKPKFTKIREVEKPKRATVVKPRKTQADAITRIAKQVHAIIVEPQLAIMLGIIFLALYIHHYHADESIIAKAVVNLKGNAASQHLGEWLEANVP